MHKKERWKEEKKRVSAIATMGITDYAKPVFSRIRSAYLYVYCSSCISNLATVFVVFSLSFLCLLLQIVDPPELGVLSKRMTLHRKLFPSSLSFVSADDAQIRQRCYSTCVRHPCMHTRSERVQSPFGIHPFFCFLFFILTFCSCHSCIATDICQNRDAIENLERERPPTKTVRNR